MDFATLHSMTLSSRNPMRSLWIASQQLRVSRGEEDLHRDVRLERPQSQMGGSSLLELLPLCLMGLKENQKKTNHFGGSLKNDTTKC